MQLAAWDLGIGSCIASMWELEKAKAILSVPQDLHFAVAISTTAKVVDLVYLSRWASWGSSDARRFH